MAKQVKKQFVLLSAKDVKGANPTKFSVAIANQLLSLSNSQWELKDDKFKWNGTEITKA